jgi:hypothetical protein
LEQVRGIFSARHDFVVPAQPGLRRNLLKRFRRRSLRRNLRVVASSLQPVRFPNSSRKENDPPSGGSFSLEQVRGIEPLPLPWQGSVLPLNHTCSSQLTDTSQIAGAIVLRSDRCSSHKNCSRPDKSGLRLSFCVFYLTHYLVPGPRVELGTPASSGQRSTDELARHFQTRNIL